MNSNVKRASGSKKIQCGLVALVALLLIGALFVGAGAATQHILKVENQDGATLNSNSYTITYDPLKFGVGDDVTVTVKVVGSDKSSTAPTNFAMTVTNTEDVIGNPVLDLSGVTITWSYENCEVENPYYKLNDVDAPSYTRDGNTVVITSRPDDVFGSVEVSGTLVPENGKVPTATLTVSGKVTKGADYSSYLTKTDEVKQIIDQMVDVTAGDRNDLEGYKITATLIRDDHYTGGGGGGNPTTTTPEIPTPPATQTATVQADGTASATLGGVAYTIDLGAGATGSVIVTALGSDVQLPAGATVLAGSDITLTVPLANGKTATVSMTISKSKLPEGASAADVVMQHFKNGKWEDLATVYTVTGNTVKYSGETDSFSPFILVYKVNGATPAIPTDVPTQTATPTETPASPAFGVLAVLAGLGAVAALRKD